MSEGASDFSTRVHYLRLPDSFDNMRILDIGCGEGNFCLDAVKRGASEVIGIDVDPSIIGKAKRHHKIKYICSDWWNLPAGVFDIIYFLDCFQYEEDLGGYLQLLKRKLSDKGLLIMECGVPNLGGAYRVPLTEDDVRKNLPSRSLLHMTLEKFFSTRYWGLSPHQTIGNKLFNHVYHCRKRLKTVICVGGKSETGKTTIAHALSRNENVHVFSTDEWCSYVKSNKNIDNMCNPIYKKIKEECNLHCMGIFFDSLSDEENVYLANAVFDAIPFEFDYTILEGYPLINDVFRRHLHSIFLYNNIRIWDLSYVGNPLPISYTMGK